MLSGTHFGRLETGTETNRRTSTFRAIASLSSGVALLVAIGLLIRALPTSGSPDADALIGFAICLPLVAWLAWGIVTAPVEGWVLWALLLAGAAVGFPLSWAGLPLVAAPFKVVAGVAAGRLLGRQMAEGWWLALVALVALAADTWSVFAGPTKMIVEHAPGALSYLLISFPALGRTSGGFGLGMSDLFFMGLFVAGSLNTGLRARGTLFAGAGSLLLTVLAALLVRSPLPALPLLSLSFLVMNGDLLWRGARVSWRDRP